MFPAQNEAMLTCLYLQGARMHEMYDSHSTGRLLLPHEESTYKSFIDAIGWHDVTKHIWEIINMKTIADLYLNCPNKLFAPIKYGANGWIVFLQYLNMSARALYINGVKNGYYNEKGAIQHQFVLPEYRTTEPEFYSQFFPADDDADPNDPEAATGTCEDINFHDYPLMSKIVARLDPTIIKRIANGEVEEGCWFPKHSEQSHNKKTIIFGNTFVTDLEAKNNIVKETKMVPFHKLLMVSMFPGGLNGKRPKPNNKCKHHHECINPFHYGKQQRWPLTYKPKPKPQRPTKKPRLTDV